MERGLRQGDLPGPSADGNLTLALQIPRSTAMHREEFSRHMVESIVSDAFQSAISSALKSFGPHAADLRPANLFPSPGGVVSAARWEAPEAGEELNSLAHVRVCCQDPRFDRYIGKIVAHVSLNTCRAMGG